ncbi:hypothetical protein D3C78_1667820 [compost metagenome]
MPRLGVVAARMNAGSSSSLANRRRYDKTSRTSALSKKLCPPEIVYGIFRLRSACSRMRDW